ncbi:MAG: diguanylate cyclase [Geminicoccaceae bacterium]
MRLGWGCFLLEAHAGALNDLQLCLEARQIACRRSIPSDSSPAIADDLESVLVVELDSGSTPPRQLVEAWQAAGRAILALCREHDPKAMMLAASLAADDVLTFPLDERELLRRLERLADLATLERERRVRTRLLATYQTGRYDISWPHRAPEAVPTVCILGQASAARTPLAHALPAVLISYIETPARLGAFLAATTPDVLLVTRPDDLAGALASIDEAGTPIGTPAVLAAYHGPPALEQLPPPVDLLPLPAPSEMIRTRLRTALRVAGLRRWLRRPPQAQAPNLILDSLTGLYNAGLLFDYVSAERHDRQLALIGIRLDNLREINAEAGYAAGNLALAEIGRQLARVTRPDDLAAYLGAGRFVVAVASHGPIQVEPMRQRLQHLLARGKARPCRLMVEAERSPPRGEPMERIERLFRELARLRRAA